MNLDHSMNIPRTWPQKEEQIEFSWHITNITRCLPSCADFPCKLGMQIKFGAWNLQYNQCNLAAHTDIAHNHCVQDQACL